MTDDRVIRLTAGLGLAALAVITAIVSYLHGLAVVRSTGSTGAVAYLIPFVADLMIITASMALLEAARSGGIKPKLAIVSLMVGIGSTVAMNVVAGLGHGTGGALVASLPPVALVLSLETLMGLVRRARAGSQPGHPRAAASQCQHGAASTADAAAVAAFLHGRDCLGSQPSQRQLSAAFGISRPKVAELVGSLNGQHRQDTENPLPDERA
jgi:hypothetical protein